NALRHTPAGGHVTISATQQGAGTILIEVADTGEGMTPEQLGHIFERFYRGDSARNRDHGGTGIGLTTCRALIEAHGETPTPTSPRPIDSPVVPSRLPLNPRITPYRPLFRSEIKIPTTHPPIPCGGI